VSWKNSYISLDTETSGVGTSARILEVAVVVFENGAPVHTYSQLFCPDIDYTEPKVAEALSVNKLRYDDLHGKPTFEQALPDLLVELAHPVWVAHNMDFDFRMLRQEFERLGRPLEPPPLRVCTMSLSSYLNPSVKGHKLGDVAGRCGVQQDGAHRAAVDATVCGHILTVFDKNAHFPEDLATMAEICKKADVQWKARFRRW
jgi:DNA polymerase III epsilon subunit-like protein